MAEIGFKKCYFLAPTRYYAPEKRIKLGNIISSPTAPDEPLNDLPFTIDVANIEEHSETNWSVSRGKNNEVKLGLWASFLQFILGIGGDVGGGQKTDSSQTLRCEKVTTREFNPSRAFVQDCIQDTGVKEYLVENQHQYVFGGHSSKKIYMVTGVKIASGASLVAEAARQRNIHLHLGVDGTSAGVPASGDPEVQVTSGRTKGESFDSADVFVLGFRLRSRLGRKAISAKSSSQTARPWVWRVTRKRRRLKSLLMNFQKVTREVQMLGRVNML